MSVVTTHDNSVAEVADLFLIWNMHFLSMDLIFLSPVERDLSANGADV